MSNSRDLELNIRELAEGLLTFSNASKSYMSTVNQPCLPCRPDFVDALETISRASTKIVKHIGPREQREEG